MSDDQVLPLVFGSSDGPPLLSVLIPALNEEATLEEVLHAVLAVPVALEIVLVDDGSSDSTWQIMQRWDDGERVRAFHHPAPLGKGRAVRTALEHARGELVLIQDADMEYDPRDYVRLLEPLVNGRAKVVYGTRTFASHTAYSFWYVLGNKGVTTAANLLYNVYLSDIQTAYKVFPRKAGLAMDLEASGFDIDPEITAKLLRMGYRIHEVPVEYIARSREEGKKVKPSDGVKALMTLSRFRMWRPRATAASLEPHPVDILGHEARDQRSAAGRR